MTREEARKVARHSWEFGDEGRGTPESIVDILIALGLLKLDEPVLTRPQMDPRLRFKIEQAVYMAGPRFDKPATAQQIIDSFHGQGLEIVEA